MKKHHVMTLSLLFCTMVYNTEQPTTTKKRKRTSIQTSQERRNKFARTRENEEFINNQIHLYRMLQYGTHSKLPEQESAFKRAQKIINKKARGNNNDHKTADTDTLIGISKMWYPPSTKKTN